MEENKFWLRLWQSAFALAGVLTLTVGGCSAYQNRLVSEAIKDGKDPIAIYCAMSGVYSGNAAVCAIKATR